MLSLFLVFVSTALNYNIQHSYKVQGKISNVIYMIFSGGAS